MSKMSLRKKRRKLSKLLKSAKNLKIRKPIASPSKILKTKKQYSRSENKQIAKEVSVCQD